MSFPATLGADPSTGAQERQPFTAVEWPAHPFGGLDLERPKIGVVFCPQTTVLWGRLWSLWDRKPQGGKVGLWRGRPGLKEILEPWLFSLFLLPGNLAHLTHSPVVRLPHAQSAGAGATPSVSCNKPFLPGSCFISDCCHSDSQPPHSTSSKEQRVPAGSEGNPVRIPDHSCQLTTPKPVSW